MPVEAEAHRPGAVGDLQLGRADAARLDAPASGLLRLDEDGDGGLLDLDMEGADLVPRVRADGQGRGGDVVVGSKQGAQVEATRGREEEGRKEGSEAGGHQGAHATPPAPLLIGLSVLGNGRGDLVRDLVALLLVLLEPFQHEAGRLGLAAAA